MGFNDQPNLNEDGIIVSRRAPQDGPAVVSVFDKIVLNETPNAKGYRSIRIPFAVYQHEEIQWLWFVNPDPSLPEGIRKREENKIVNLLDVLGLRDEFLKGFKERGGNMGNPLAPDEKNLQILVNGLNILLPNKVFEVIIETSRREWKTGETDENGEPIVRTAFDVNFAKMGRWGCGIVAENKGKAAPRATTASFASTARNAGTQVTAENQGFGG